tara:strand:+ start:330 stop:590 length:261 start_codon:yes stop_codon:yes gene_type:complete
MANHKSAKKRSRQTLKKKQVNVQYLTKIRTALNSFESSIKSKNQEDISKSFAEVNSTMSKALKRGIIKKHLLSRKLSSLSKQIKNI